MSDVGAMVAELIDAGCAPDVAAAVVARAFVSGVSSAGFRGIPVDETAEKRRAYDRERKRKSTGIPPESAEVPVSSIIETKIKNSKKQNSERPSRGTRIEPDWLPSQAEREFAGAEGLSNSEIDREAARFRDYWKGRAGSGGVKLDWTATWQNWIRSTAEKLGRTPRRSAGEVDSSMFHAKFGSEELDAWDNYARGKTGKSMPRDAKGGWTVPTQWPPGYTPMKEADKRPFVPNLKAM